MESCASRHRPPPRHLAGRNLEAVGELEVRLDFVRHGYPAPHCARHGGTARLRRRRGTAGHGFEVSRGAASSPPGSSSSSSSCPPALLGRSPLRQSKAEGGGSSICWQQMAAQMATGGEMAADHVGELPRRTSMGHGRARAACARI
jgi:hypothetical protein